MRFPSCLLPSALLPALLCPALLHAQTPPAADAVAALTRARSLYYTPADQGLDGFHCDVSFDWKSFLEKAMNQPVPDTEPRLKYLEGVHLSVDDDLHGTGELHWAGPGLPPDGTEDSVTKLRDGFQQIWSGFFQSWNGFFTGDLVTPDSNTVVRLGNGSYKVTAHNGTSLAEEVYNSSLVLTSVKVSTPTLESLMTPSFVPSPKGLLVSEIHSVYRQPPTTSPTEVSMRLSYAPVSTFELPSSVAITVGPASFNFHLVNCTVKLRVGAK